MEKKGQEGVSFEKGGNTSLYMLGRGTWPVRCPGRRSTLDNHVNGHTLLMLPCTTNCHQDRWSLSFMTDKVGTNLCPPAPNNSRRFPLLVYVGKYYLFLHLSYRAGGHSIIDRYGYRSFSILSAPPQGINIKRWRIFNDLYHINIKVGISFTAQRRIVCNNLKVL